MNLTRLQNKKDVQVAKGSAKKNVSKLGILKRSRLNTWYGWLAVTFLLTIIDAILYSLGIHYSALIAMFFIILFTGMLSFVQATRGGLKGSVRKSKKTSHENPRTIKGVLSRVLASLLVIASGLFIGITAVALPFDSFAQHHSISIAETEEEQQTIHDTEAKRESVKLWQYMLCSDGSYRFYTDEQFKNTQVGFTEDSEDSCAANGNGQKTSLADEPPNTTSQQMAQPVYPGQKNCRYIDIPFRTDREPVSWLDVGQEQSSLVSGWPGRKEVCTDSRGNETSVVISEPRNTTVYYGTRTPKKDTHTSPPSPRRSCEGLASQGLANSTFYDDCLRGH